MVFALSFALESGATLNSLRVLVVRSLGGDDERGSTDE